MDDFEYDNRVPLVINHIEFKNFLKITDGYLKSINHGIKIITKFYYKKDVLYK